MNLKKTEIDKTAKILVVDDQPENLFAMEAMLKDVGAQVFKAESGKEALSMMLHHNFAMVFLDVQMPEMDGFELAKLIHGNDKTKNIPIIFLSAYSKEDQFIYKGYEAGAVDYILKPFNNDVVKQKAKVFLELNHQKALLEQTTLELSETNKKLQEAKDELELRINERTQELTIANENLNQEIIKYQQAEKYQKLTAQILELLNHPGESKSVIQNILSLIHISTGFEAVGIRLQNEEDFPYIETRGFSAKFIEAERYLCACDNNGKIVRDSNGKAVLECMCGNILSGRTDISLPIFTDGGSFWTNSTTELLNIITDKERLTPLRNRCNIEGYESVALIPLHFGDKIVGLLQINDRQKGVFNIEMINYFEGIGASIGITLERIRAEEEIRTLNQVLEQRIKDRTAQLENSNKELEAFSYSVSHDLRTPLRSIDGFSQALLEEYQDKVDAQGKDYLYRVRSATQRMGHLIDDMLNLSRVSRTEMNIRQVNLSEMAQEIVDDLYIAQPDRQAVFIIQEEIKAQGDERLLRIVLENLLENAWKYTSKHPTALIEFGMQLQNETPVYFVRDDGAGFDMNYAAKLFDAFQRLHTNTEFPGTGVGLATVQRVIHRHGGKVWAEGEVEKGTTIYFTIQ